MLYIYEGDWGLPSIQPESLAVITYCKLASYDVITECGNDSYQFLPFGILPCFKHDDNVCSGVGKIFDYLEKMDVGLDGNLSASQICEKIALIALIEQKLKSAIEHMFWIDTKNYTVVTRARFAKASPFPLNFILPNQHHKKIRKHLSSRYTFQGTDEIKIYAEAKELLNLLDSYLVDSNYLLGDRPSGVDAMAISYLALILRAPLLNNALQTHLNLCPNLLYYCNRLINNLFPLSETDKSNMKSTHTKISTDEFAHKWRNLFISSAVAITAMIAYALASGLVKIETVNSVDSQSPDLSSFSVGLSDKSESASTFAENSSDDDD